MSNTITKIELRDHDLPVNPPSDAELMKRANLFIKSEGIEGLKKPKKKRKRKTKKKSKKKSTKSKSR